MNAFSVKIFIALLLLSFVHISNAAAKIKRSLKARHEFMKQTGYMKGRPGYIVDHIIPLACGGPDKPENMQWQTKEEAKAKDEWERQWCK